MKRILFALLSAAAVLPAGSASAATLRVLQPADRSVVGGTVRFQIMPEHARTDRIYAHPDVTIQDEFGHDLHQVAAARDPKTGICSAAFDTRQLVDGMYLVKITYKTLHLGTRPIETREDLVIGVRNRPRHAGRFDVELEEREYKVGESADLTVRVYDRAKKLMPGARVTFQVDSGELSTDAEITDREGEGMTSIEVDEPGKVTVIVRVENLPVVKKVITFTAAE